MFIHRLDQVPSRRVAFSWYLLCFNGGLINAGGFLATGRFVSHVTGFATLFGVEVVHHNLEPAIGILSVPFFFLMGAFFAGMMIDRRIYMKKKPHFDYVMVLSALCLFLVAGGGKLLSVQVLLSLLCLACGLQNGAITSSSGSSIRTTHLTGLTTDLGLGLARLFTVKSQKQIFKQESLANQLRFNSILAFFLGSSVGAAIFLIAGYRSFVLPGLIATYAAIHGRKLKSLRNKKILRLNMPKGI